MEDGAPIYVKIEDYKDVLDVISLVKEKLDEANSILDKITDLKVKEDSEIENWRSEINEVQTKISMIDKTLVNIN
jgi:hypothetical protein